MTRVRVTTAWMVRAGWNGEREQAALTEGLVIAGWEEVDDLSAITNKLELREVVEATYPDASPARIANWTGQLWRMISEIAPGDLVVTPLKRRPEIAVGRIASEYAYRADVPPGFRHVRKVDWLRNDIPRAAVQQDLLDSMGSLLTVCRLERFGAADRIAALASSGIDPGPPGDDADAKISSKRELAERAAASSADGPLRLSVRDLLSIWGAIRRSASIVGQIEQELAELGLTARPAFTDGGIDDKITIVAVGEEPKKDDPSTSRDTDNDEPKDFAPIAPRIGVIEAANASQVVTVEPHDDIAVAVTRMIAHGYSQLAVVDGDGEETQLRGAISWASIGTSSVTAPPKKVNDAMFYVRAVHNRDFLLPLVDEIYRNDFLFVCSDDSPLTGIVTAADLTQRFGQTTRPLVLIEEAERRLRINVGEVFNNEDFKAAGVRYNPSTGASPTIGNYVHLLKNPEMWKKLSWPIHHEFFMDRLEELRVARNDFMHFNPDPLSPEQLESLEGFVRLLRAVDSRD
jgi:restriction system protein